MHTQTHTPHALRVCVCVCVCVRERERERECAQERGRITKEGETLAHERYSVHAYTITGIYVHHIGTRVSIPHTYTNTICGGGTYCNLVRGAKMPSGSAAILLLLRYRYLHTRAAGVEHKCLLLPVPACWRTCLPAHAFRYPYTHPHVHTHLQSPITTE